MAVYRASSFRSIEFRKKYLGFCYVDFETSTKTYLEIETDLPASFWINQFPGPEWKRDIMDRVYYDCKHKSRGFSYLCISSCKTNHTMFRGSVYTIRLWVESQTLKKIMSFNKSCYEQVLFIQKCWCYISAYDLKTLYRHKYLLTGSTGPGTVEDR